MPGSRPWPFPTFLHSVFPPPSRSSARWVLAPWSTLAALSVWVLRLKGELPWALRKLQL